jgi:hypothetical protein
MSDIAWLRKSVLAVRPCWNECTISSDRERITVTDTRIAEMGKL